MGASDWRYFVPYQADVQKVFEELQQLIFAEGRYYRRGYAYDDSKIQALSDQLYENPDLSPEEIERTLKPMYEEVWRNPIMLPMPKTIEELREQNAEDGTHSILDMQGISETKGWWELAPLSSAQLTEYFGTDEPTHSMIEESLNRQTPSGYWHSKKSLAVPEMKLSLYLQQIVDRWRGQGTYIIVYNESEPAEILFVGYSGD